MFSNTLFLIPAREGSKRLPGKNIKILDGIPLISHTLKLVLNIVSPKNICISTDSLDIIKIANELGIEVPFIRPSYLSGDSASSSDVLMHCLNFYEGLGINFDNVILLQPTSPFRTIDHLLLSYELFNKNGANDMVASVYKYPSSFQNNLFSEKFDRLSKVQFENSVVNSGLYKFNGSIYIMSKKMVFLNGGMSFEKVIKYEMDLISSIDIDTEYDWNLAEYVSRLWEK
uniref:acylneuraminate cytidylyltransferase family protein n=1 Tax=Flavobacterium sp. TaxID=239 RepID=UPI004049E6E9